MQIANRNGNACAILLPRAILALVLFAAACSGPTEPTTSDVDVQLEEPACNLVPTLPGCP